MEKAKTPTMRTIENAVKELKQLDPKSDMTTNAIRTFAREGLIKSVNTGKKVYVNFDSLIDFLNGNLV